MLTKQLNGTWTRLTPQFSAQDLSIALEGEAPAITISNIQSEFNLLRSALNAEIIWSDLRIGQVKLTLQEDADGSWSIGNIPITNLNDDTNDSGQLDVLFDIALLSTHIGIEQISLQIAFYGGVTTTFFINDIRIENEGSFHRMAARLSIDEAADGAELLIEGRGDPKDWASFDGQAYVNLKQINLRGPLTMILRDWLPPSITNVVDTNTQLDAEFWIQSLKDGHFDLRGTLHADEIPLNWTAQLPAIKNLDSTITGWFVAGDSWGLQWQDLHFDWGEKKINPLNLEFKQRLGTRWNEVSLSADHINLEILKWSLLETQLGGDKITELLDTLNPSGQLNGVQLSLNLKKTQPLTSFNTRIDQLSLDSWHHTPAIRKLSGYFHWQNNQGFFDFDVRDGFAMHYPGVYDKFMNYGSTQGRINLAWHNVNSALQIAGGPIDIRGKEGQIRAYINLDIPINNPDREPEMFLQAGIKNSHSRYRNNYLPAILNPGLLDWLERSITDVDIVEAGFIWRGSLKGNSPHKRSIQFYGQMANGEIDYDPGWPRLSKLSAQITIDDDQLNGIISSAKLGQAKLDKAIIATHPGALLSIKAEINTPLGAAIDSLLNSPIANRITALQDWKIKGNARARLDLMIPLSQSHKGEAYHVQADIDRGRMQLRDFQPIIFNDLEGSITYNSLDGLHSPRISGTFWGQALNATIATQGNKLQIDASGLFDLSKAPAWQSLFTDNVTGKTTYTASFVSPDNDSPAKLTLHSDLEGIAIDLPAPLYKSAGLAWPLVTSLQFLETGLLVDANTDKLKAQLRIANQQLTDGTITLGSKEEWDNSGESTPKHKGLLITGHTPVFQLNDWLEALQANTGSTSVNNISSFDTRAMVEIDSFNAGRIGIDTVTIDALHSKQLWDINIESPTLAGNIRVPEGSSQTIVARLHYLTLPEPELNSEQGFLNDLDPSTLPALDFATDGLRIGDDELGSLAFVMRANEHGVSIDQIEAEITGITIDNTPDGDAAQLIWTNINGEHRSEFTGALLSDDLGGVLKAWDMPTIFTTKRAAFLTDLSWQGKPWDLSTRALRGNIALRFEKGRFFQAPGTTTNTLLKVVGLINFDTWLRRLKFDFSDLFSKGVHFDNLEGGLVFEEFQMRFDEPIIVTLPSGKIHLRGHTNLVDETIDARLVATLPVGTNLPWIVALAGGLPAAAGVYITSKLFEKQVNRISSISYKITGDLNNPEVKVDRIFSDKTE